MFDKYDVSNFVITVREVKDWCRIDCDADDLLIESLIETVQAEAAAYTGLILTLENCPAPVRSAIAVRAADLYANREGALLGERTFHALLNPYRSAL